MSYPVLQLVSDGIKRLAVQQLNLFFAFRLLVLEINNKNRQLPP